MTSSPHSFEFTFHGTVEELALYVTQVFRDGSKLRVHARVMLPVPSQPEWFVRLGSYGSLPSGVGPGSFSHVSEEVVHGRKIGAIKALRAITGWDLRTAKDAVEQVFVPRAEAAAATGKEFSLE